ncbi:MFS transporter [Streptomyces sp. NPDC059828]|uniref:MFS transporter n=1 Tax=Streptomyces sp. NPDC059828 TaxID=3346965 RepID=UPI00365A28A6
MHTTAEDSERRVRGVPRSYLLLLRTPGVARLAFWGTVGRFPIAMRSISCLMLASVATASLADAGTVAAVMLAAQAVASPVFGRLADRLSQRRVLLTACPAHAVGMTLLVVSIAVEAPLWLPVLAAAATGCTSVSFASFMRARWAVMVDRDALRTAYAMESMLDDTIFLLGPLLVTVLTSYAHPAAGLVACLALTTVGSIAVALHRQSEPAHRETSSVRSPRRVITVTGVWLLVIIYAGMGFLFGAIDVAMVAVAQERSAPALGGVLLSLMAVGSLLGGLLYGGMHWRLPQARLLSITTCVLTLATLPLVFTHDWAVTLSLAFIAGIATSPALITGSALLESLAPKASLSEAFSWLTSASALGVGLGTAIGGRLAFLGSSSQAAWAAVGGGTVALALSLAGQPALRRTRSAAEPDPAPVMAIREP